MKNKRISIAPMMACTDRHYRYLARLMSRHVVLYTEMVTAKAVIHGNREKLLGYNASESPLVLQLGGSDPGELKQASRIAEYYHYDEINLNIGCPSDRVQSGQFGACLMKSPALVARCYAEMQQAVAIPVTIKTRIGVDEYDDYEFLTNFIQTVAKEGCQRFIIHARKAWLQGLSPRQNREVPPLLYERVYQLKQDFPELKIEINGGIKTMAQSREHLRELDGVMIGREAYSNPYLIAEFDSLFDDQYRAPGAQEVIMRYLPYLQQQLDRGVGLRHMIRHLVGMFPGVPGSRQWRRYLSEHGGNNRAGVEVITRALACLQSPVTN